MRRHQVGPEAAALTDSRHRAADGAHQGGRKVGHLDDGIDVARALLDLDDAPGVAEIQAARDLGEDLSLPWAEHAGHQTLMSAFLMISPNDARSRSMVAPKVAGSWKLA
jgi:hypothetical protein